MTDPFRTLRLPAEVQEPDAGFASNLRARLARAFDLPRGVTVSNLTIDDVDDIQEETTADSGRVATGSGALTPYLAVAGARRAIEWYGRAFGARAVGEPIVMPDGRIGHAELEVSGARLMLSEEHPEIGVVAPDPAASNVTLHLEVDDVDAVVERAVALGAELRRAAADHDYGRNGVLVDPFGHRWMVSGPVRAQSVRHPGLRHGDIAYVSLQVPDVERAAAFYADVLGWHYRPGSGPQGRQVEGLTMHHGLWGGVAEPTLFLCIAVDDVPEAVQRVRAAGGTAGEPHRQSYGLVADCVDDQGTGFAVFEPPEGTVAGLPAAALDAVRNGRLAGDVGYVTVEVVDSARARAFYGAVAGWRFAPGNVADGWQVVDTVPMTGLSGGHARATTVAMYRVADVAAAAERVRLAGGTPGEIEVHPYGSTSLCTDDQGARFYLGQLGSERTGG